MSETPYDAISQGRVMVPMENYGQQRVMPPQQGWCTPRRTCVIVAIVLLSLLYLSLIIIYVVVFAAVATAASNQVADYKSILENNGYSSHGYS